MMDLKEIIRWFIPCFHLLVFKKRKMDVKLTLVCLCLAFNFGVGNGISDSDVVVSNNNNLENTKNLDLIESKNEGNVNFNQSEYFAGERNENLNESRNLEDSSVGQGRTFGRPFKKMMAAMIPLVFQIGAASTWAVVAALVGVKTLLITLVILKLLLVAGAAKFGALFASKGHEHHSHGWQPPPHQKEIHLHIHNGHHGHEHYEEHAPITSWSREGYPLSQDTKNINVILDPYRGGPQTISTPFGNYVKVDPLASAST